MKQKQFRSLHSKAGSSLLLALAFFLLCSFVGSTVLAAAAGNAGRMAGLRQQRQDYFSQRSAAAVLEEHLSEKLKLTIDKTTTTVTTKVANDLGGVTVSRGDPTYAIKCHAPAGQKALDTLLYQAAANAYRASGDAGAEPDVTFVEFPSGITNWSSLYPSTGSGSIALTLGSEALETQPFGYTCDDGYGFTLAPGGENAQLHLYLPASVTKTSVTTAVEVEVTDNTSTETETKTQTITISWQAPVVRKGDSE